MLVPMTKCVEVTSNWMLILLDVNRMKEKGVIVEAQDLKFN